MGLDSPPRCFPKSPPTSSSDEGTSPGVSRPFSAWGGRNSRPTRLPVQAPRGLSPGFHRRVPPRRLRRRSQAFPASQRLLVPSAVLPFSGRWRSWGPPSRGLFPPHSPGGSSPTAALLTFLPPAALPLPRQGNRQARRQHLDRAGRQSFVRLQGLQPCGGRSAPPGSLWKPSQPTCPSWAMPPRGLHPVRYPGANLETATLHAPPGPSPDRGGRCVSRSAPCRSELCFNFTLKNSRRQDSTRAIPIRFSPLSHRESQISYPAIITP
jgi:hypothetical protein